MNDLEKMLEFACDARDSAEKMCGIGSWQVTWWSGYIKAIEEVAGV